MTAPMAVTNERVALGPEQDSRKSPQRSSQQKVKGGWRPLKFFHVDPDDQHYVGCGELITRDKLEERWLWLDIADVDLITSVAIRRLAKIRGESVSDCISSLLLARISKLDSDYYFAELDGSTTSFFDRIPYDGDYGFSFSEFADYFNRRKQAGGRRVHFIKKNAFPDIDAFSDVQTA
jgi:hypothetical protein